MIQTHLEVLKSKDVQDTDGSEVFFAPDAVVELADDPVETLRIKCHGHGVSGVHRLQRSRESNTNVVSLQYFLISLYVNRTPHDRTVILGLWIKL